MAHRVGQKIRKLKKEGKTQKQAVGEALGRDRGGLLGHPKGTSSIRRKQRRKR